MQHLLTVVLFLGSACSCTTAEKLSAEQKAPQFADRSAGGSLALPRDAGASSALAQLLAGLHIKPSGQTPADTSLLRPSSRRANATNPLELLHIKASGQTPADTSLLPAAATAPKASSQSRRAGQGPAHVTLINAEKQAPNPAAGLQTPANVGLLRPGAGAPPGRPAATVPQQDGVQRDEMTSFKEVDGQSVRVVVGNYGYASPEGLPVSFKYMSDENGNQASFSIGKAGASGGSTASRPSTGGASGSGKAAAGKNTGGSAKGFGGAAGKNGAGTGAGADRNYLPPK